jgi:hypothetical protein
MGRRQVGPVARLLLDQRLCGPGIAAGDRLFHGLDNLCDAAIQLSQDARLDAQSSLYGGRLA